VLIRLREDGVLLPRRRNGSPRVTGALPTYPAVHDLLTNPAYAGAFVFGRTRTEKRVDPVTGAVHSRDRLVPREHWEVLISDHHPGSVPSSIPGSSTRRAGQDLRSCLLFVSIDISSTPRRGHLGGVVCSRRSFCLCPAHSRRMRMSFPRRVDVSMKVHGDLVRLQPHRAKRRGCDPLRSLNIATHG
jgi:hypothetical protein